MFTKPDNENRHYFLTTNPTTNEKKLCQVMPSYGQKCRTERWIKPRYAGLYQVMARS